MVAKVQLQLSTSTNTGLFSEFYPNVSTMSGGSSSNSSSSSKFGSEKAASIHPDDDDDDDDGNDDIMTFTTTTITTTTTTTTGVSIPSHTRLLPLTACGGVQRGCTLLCVTGE